MATDKKNNIEIGIETILDPASKKAFDDLTALINGLGKTVAKKTLDSLFSGVTKDAKNLSNQIDILTRKFGENLSKDGIGKLNAQMNRLKIDSGQAMKWIARMNELQSKINPSMSMLGDKKVTSQEKVSIAESLIPLMKEQQLLSEKILKKSKIIEQNRQELKHNIDILKLETSQVSTIEKKSKLESTSEEKIKQYSKILSDVATKYNTHYKVTQGILAQEKLINEKKRELYKLSGSAFTAAQKELSIEQQKLKALNELANTQKGSFRESITNAFSLEKIVNRMAFVITAKLSYEAFDAFNRFFREGVENAIKLEQHLTRIMSITRGQNQDILKQGAIQSIGRGFKVEDISQAIYESASAQFTNEETARLIDESSKMAVAGFTSQTEAMQALTSVIRAYNLDTDDATRVSDWFFKVIELGRTELKDLAPEIGKVSATANLLGIGMDEVGTAIATMTMQGIKTNVAITSLNQLFMNMTNPTQEAKEILEKYGLTLDLAQVKAQGLAKTVQQLSVLTDEEITTIASSKQGFRALAVAINDNAQWQENLNKIVESGGSTQKAYSEQTETTAFKLAKMRGEIIKLGIDFGEVIIKLSPVITAVSDIIKGINGEIVGMTAVLAGLASVIMLKVIPAILALTPLQAVFGSLGLVIVGLSWAIGAYQRKQEELAEFERERHQKKLNELNEEQNKLEEESKLLNTYAGLKEKEATKEGISRREKELLNVVQKQLTESYGYSITSLKNYNNALEINTTKQKENFEAIKQAKLMALSEKSLKASTILSERPNIPLGFGNKTDYDRISPIINKIEFEQGLGTFDRQAPTEFDLSYVQRSIKQINEGAKAYYDEFDKANFNDKEKAYNRYKTYKSMFSKHLDSLKTVEEIYTLKLMKYKKTKENSNRIELSSSDLKKKIIYTQKDSAKDNYEDEKNLYQLKGNNLTELLKAKKDYLDALLNDGMDEKLRNKESSKMNNEIIQLVSKNYKDLVNNELNLLNEKEKNETDIINSYGKIDLIYARELRDLKKVNNDADTIAKVESEKIKSNQDKQLLLDKIKYAKELQTLEIKLDEINSGRAKTLAETYLGKERTPEEIRTQKLNAINASGVTPDIKIEKTAKVEEEYKKSTIAETEKSNQEIINQATMLSDNLLKIWDNYTTQRMAQIEKEKQARFDSIDNQAKVEYRSSIWIANEKIKAEKKAENERKKYARLRKATAISELTMNFAVAIMKSYAVLGPLGALFKPLLIGNYIAGLAMISAQKFEKGGIVKGKRHYDGGVPIEAEGGEVMFSRKASQGREQILNNINTSLNNGMNFETALRKNVPTLNTTSVSNTYNNNTGFMDKLSSKLDSVVSSIENIQMNVEIHGQVLSDIQFAKKVRNGNKMMVGI